MSFNIRIRDVKFDLTSPNLVVKFQIKKKKEKVLIFKDFNFILNILIRVFSFKNVKFELSIYHISHPFFLDIFKLKPQLMML